MGCLCAKPKKSNQDSSVQLNTQQKSYSFAKGSQQEEIFNILHENDLNDRSLITIAELIINCNQDSKNKKSLVHPPPQDQLLLCRSWVYKRGHVIRNWRKRYCVVDKTELKYYSGASDAPPYGKNLKGKIGMLGAICIVKQSLDGNFLDVEIYGNLGDKDLFFQVENDEEGKEFVRCVEWAFRKTTQTMLLRRFKNTLQLTSDSGSSSKNSGGLNLLTVKDGEKYQCEDWIEHEKKLYIAAVKRLQEVQLVQFFHILEDGAIVLQPGVIQLWHAFGEDTTPDYDTSISEVGLAWHLIDYDAYQAMKSAGCYLLSTSQQQIITCEDIIDISYQTLDASASNCLNSRICQYHHATCRERPYSLLTIHTSIGHDLHLIICCLYDYHGFALALQNLILFQLRKQRMLTVMQDVLRNRYQKMNSSQLQQLSAVEQVIQDIDYKV